MSFKSTKTHSWKHVLVVVVTLLATLYTNRISAQVHSMVFSSTDPGVTRSITNWGLDTCWPSYDNMLRGLIFMGTNNVNIVRVGFFVDAPLTNNDVTPTDKTNMQTDIGLASMATAATKWDLNLDSGVDAYYISGANTVYADRWAAAIEACQRYYNRGFWAVEGFNEPDYTVNNEGSPQNLYDIFGYLQASTNFPGALMEGGSTLNDDVATSWFNPIASRAGIGSTHCLAGSATSYMNFLQTVAASNSIPFNPELHNVMEAIMGVNYGLQGGIWWGSAERARGAFVQACQGKRLSYADDLNNWTAAAVYRAPSGAVQAFFGASERMATTTGYWLFSKDRAVFFDGVGPKHDYLVTVPGGNGYQVNQANAERVVNITWGADVQPAINGRYILVNRNSGLVLDLPGASTNNGVQLDQNTYTGATSQQWDVRPMPDAFGGDVSYYSLNNASSGVTVDVAGGSYANGAVIQQWNGGTNVFEQWILEYTTNGYFKVRTKWCDKLMSVSGGSSSAGAMIVQSDDTGTLDQQWRLVPASAGAYDFVAPATPAGASASGNAASVALSWNANTESDLAGYNVLRATNSGGPYEIVARGLTNASFADGSVVKGQTYYYVVAATDKSLNQSAYSTQVSATPAGGQAMLAHYTFDNVSIDSSGNGNDAELINSPGYSAGAIGSAVSLNGAGQSVVVPTGIMRAATNFTFAAWVYWNGSNQWQRIFDFGNDTTQYMFLTPNSGSGTLRFAVTTNGGGAEQQLNAAAMSIGRWFHVAVTYDGTTAVLYTNGVLAASGAVSISPSTFNPVANFLGQSQFPADPTLNGSLDDVFLYNYALTAAQIVSLASGSPPNPNAPAAPTGLAATAGSWVVNLHWTQSTNASITGNNVYRSTTGSGGPYGLLTRLAATNAYADTAVSPGNTYYYSVTATNGGGESSFSAYSGTTLSYSAPYWAFDQGSGTTATDSGGSGFNGTLQSGATWVSGVISNAVHLDGTANGYVNLPQGVVSPLSNFSIAAWVKVDTNVMWARIFDFGSGTGTYMFLTPDSGSSTVRYAITTTGGSGEQQINGPAVLSAGIWHHVAVTLTNSTGILYVDGKAVGTNGSMTLKPSSLGITTQNYIGKSQYPDPNLTGSVDDFHIYNRALSATEVATLAAAALPSPWVSVDIGSVGFTGGAIDNSGVFSVTGSGADIWGTADAFHYVYQTSSGNCEMRARVTSVQNSDPWSKSGVMVRESTAAGARNAAVFITPGNGISFQWRTTTGGSSSFTNVTAITTPKYVRVTRTSNSFSGYYSSDGTTWTQIGTSQTVTMATGATIGLAVTAHNNALLCTSTLDTLTATP